MTPSELEYKLKNLPPNTPITAEHIIAILGALQAPQSFQTKRELIALGTTTS